MVCPADLAMAVAPRLELLPGRRSRDLRSNRLQQKPPPFSTNKSDSK